MRALWRATALIADTPNGVLDKLKTVASFETREDLNNDVLYSTNPLVKGLHVKDQPTLQVLQAIDEILRQDGLCLCAYELAEINRWISQDLVANGQTLAPLLDYWKKLKAIAGDGGPGFQEAAGVMSFDNELRTQVRSGKKLKEDFGFDVTPKEETRLRAALADAAVENAAARFFDSTWPGGTCDSIMAAGNGWVHFNV